MFKLGQFTPQLKLLFHSHRIAQWMEGESVYPILVEMDLSNTCNHHCTFCNFSHLIDRSVLTKEVGYKIVGQLRMCGVKAINWTGGGEPLTNPYFPSIFTYAKSVGMEQGLFTNGALIKEEHIEVLLQTQRWIRFSIDAATPSTYYSIRGKNEFENVLQNVRTMVRVRNEMRYDTQIGIGFVITKENYTEIDKFADLITKLGVDYGQYKPCISSEHTNATWWECEVKPYLEQVFATNVKATINLYKFNDLSENQFDKPYLLCYGHVFCPCVGAEGKVYVCNQMRGKEEYCMGDLHTHSFEEIWKGKKRQEAIGRIDVGRCPPFCKNNEINKMLYHIRHPNKNTHYNFL